MSRAGFFSVPLYLFNTKHAGPALHSRLLSRKLVCPITYSSPIRTQQISTGVPKQKAATIIPVGTRIIGGSGSQYVIDRLLQEKETPDIRVYLAKFVGIPRYFYIYSNNLAMERGSS